MSWGNPQTLREKITCKLLSPAAAAYSAGSQVRMVAYACGILQRKKVEIPVYSIGNITCGGTGKTPIVIDLASRISASGKRVAVLSRGYKRESEEELTVVSDGTGDFASVKASGDEPSLIARRVPEAIVIACADRRKAAGMAASNFGCDAIILDDGFQHLKLKRDEDVVLLDYQDEPERDSLLPAGRLREPLAALKRASLIVISKIPDGFSPERIDHLTSVIRKYNSSAPISLAGTRAHSLQNWYSQTGMDSSVLSGKRVLAFSALARPEPFHNSLDSLGASLVASRAYSDHHWYSQEDINGLVKTAQMNQAEMLVTTEKDLVKLENFSFDIPVYALSIDVHWIGRVPPLFEKLNERAAQDK